MHEITVTGQEPGDYLHPDQKLQIINEETGRKFELYIRSNARASAATGEISLFIPISILRELQTDKEYCVLTFSEASSKEEAQERRKLLTGIRLGAAPAKVAAPSRRKK